MATDPTLVARLDALVSDILADWNIYTTLIAGALVAVAISSLVFSNEPDTHPFLLARQATTSPVRQPGESAVYRSLETPYGFPLKAGLNIRDPGALKWTSGRNGDLRDIWKTAVRGVLNEDGSATGKQGKIYTVLGKNVEEHSLDNITQEINVIGQHLSGAKVETVAVCLTDSIELLAAIFAGAFYGYKTVIVPHNMQPDILSAHLQKIKADALIAEAGSLDLSVVAKGNDQLAHVLWVAKYGSRHMDWSHVPEELKNRLEVNVWHNLVEENRNIHGSDVPSYDPSTPTPSVTTVWPSGAALGDFVEYSPKNLVAGISALSSVLPRPQKVTSNDLVLCIDSLSRSYPLCQVMAALFANASVALNSVAGESVDFALATAGVSPTVIIASSRTISDYHKKIMEPHTGVVSKLGQWVQSRSLEAGHMPSRNVLSQLANIGPTAELSLDKLRLLCISHRVDADREYRLTSQQLTDLRIFTGARVVYALTGPGIAGAISQTHVFDYRQHHGPSHFGVPPSSVEIFLAGFPESQVSTHAIEGQVVVSGPAVVSGTTRLLARGRFRSDNTLELVS
ncbi:hypothetical protein ASPZODRAFT_113308 [Penicilliopsis zonata CBS 506.65]|uniref:AMP-dependent synthetase/ligase domain-containing protein n=1 Tax=Penicilliopsis zonata CBS 506.65 TaxID=1073090 RepID=A0A1L9SMD6_9EURO|nr:hypothetical protein ASPZODRAFT_113308 [Penicilliopsis zonata CBS 506.65]OJJ48432.1 hypothetical protein ASPZODRAFT_113308 [Penicilliopsis zonata CBS 506.65]